jgi:hypothetical protein
MISEPIDPSRRPSRQRLLTQVAGSSLGTVFYTPGGAAGWALDLVLRAYFAYVRRTAALRARRAAPKRAQRAAAPVASAMSV